MNLANPATDAEAKAFFNELNKRHKRRGFTLNEACFPSSNKDLLEEGFKRNECVIDGNTCGISVPYIIISSSAEKTFDLFIDFLGLLKRALNVLLVSDQFRMCTRHNFGRDNFGFSCIDPFALMSSLLEFKEFLSNDGFVGIAVSDKRTGFMVCLTSHKYILIYNWLMFRRRVLETIENYGIQKNRGLKIIDEMSHIHISQSGFRKKFADLKSVLQEMGF